jgi:hypothetical protein
MILEHKFVISSMDCKLLEVNDHEADRADLEGTYYKIKSEVAGITADIVCH